MQKASQALEVGQVWTFEEGAAQFAIVGLSRHLAEIRRCRDGKVLRSGSSDLRSVRTIQRLITGGSARLTGHVVMPDNLIKLVAGPEA